MIKYQAEIMLKQNDNNRLIKMTAEAVNMSHAEKVMRQTIKDVYGEIESQICKFFSMKSVK